MSKQTKKQTKTDLTSLHGYLYKREGWDPAFSKAVAIALKTMYPKDTHAQAVEDDIKNV